MATYSALTTSRYELQTRAAAVLAARGYTYAPLTESWSAYLARAASGLTSSSVSHLRVPVAEIAAVIENNLAGTSLSSLTTSYANILAGVATDDNDSGSVSDSDWPSALNRPMWDSGTSTLSWTGPDGGGANDGSPVAQSRVLTNLASINSSSINQVIEGRNITGAVRIRHNGVILRQCRIAVAESFIIESDSGSPTGVIIEDCLIDGEGVVGTNGYNPTGGGGGSIIRRCNITACENAVGIGENAMVIEDNWIHDLAFEGEAHTDGIQGIGGFTSLTIEHNAIYSRDTSCIILQNEGSGFSGVDVNNNLLDMSAGGAACIICRGDKGAGIVGAVSFTNNRLVKPPSGGYTDIGLDVAGPITFTGNVDHITDAPVSLG